MKRQNIAIAAYALVLAVGSSLFEFFLSGTFGPLTLLMSGILVFIILYLMRFEKLSETKQREESRVVFRCQGWWLKMRVIWGVSTVIIILIVLYLKLNSII